MFSIQGELTGFQKGRKRGDGRQWGLVATHGRGDQTSPGRRAQN